MDLPKNQIQTVCGPIDPNLLGFTLMHEHLNHFGGGEMFYPRNPDPTYAQMANKPFCCSDRWWIDFHPYSHKDNLNYNDDDVRNSIIDELHFYRKNGGQSIVELTTFGRDPEYLVHLQKTTRVNVIAGTGCYVAAGMPDNVKRWSTEQLYEKMMSDFSNPITRCGLIGEIGTSYPIDPFEKRVLEAAAAISGANPTLPVNIHPGRHVTLPAETVRLFLEAGGCKQKLIMSHLDRTLLEKDQLLEFARLGVICELDLFGIETSHYELSDAFNMPSDAHRIKMLQWLVDDNRLDQVVIAHDIHTKHRLMKYGGHGFSHISMNVIPELKRRSFTDQQINQILIDNPKKLLTL